MGSPGHGARSRVVLLVSPEADGAVAARRGVRLAGGARVSCQGRSVAPQRRVEAGAHAGDGAENHAIKTVEDSWK
jgi:hypothetical protein